ncbi:unnamed protein product [Adineta steineri]|uniref:Uncharacterized protein n=1 Tax=Adineta steineri TaxID=433720 RepID=A0A820C3Y5_9BILA|nr:unnamed protein product [Adineta steineri]CAF4202573.1 unnamed protein product [Adineta steineri]
MFLVQLYIESSDDDDIFNNDMQGGYNNNSKNNERNTPWSLQKTVATIFGKFLDKTETLNFWQYGIDLELVACKQKLFSRKQYDTQTEQEAPLKMKQYASYDCTTLGELYFQETITSTKNINNLTDELPDIITTTTKSNKKSLSAQPRWG